MFYSDVYYRYLHGYSYFAPRETLTLESAGSLSRESKRKKGFFRFPGLFAGFWLISTMLKFWVVSILHLISISFSLFSNPLATDTSAPITTSIIVTLVFNIFFSFLQRFICLSFPLLLFYFCDPLDRRYVLYGQFYNIYLSIFFG